MPLHYAATHIRYAIISPPLRHDMPHITPFRHITFIDILRYRLMAMPPLRHAIFHIAMPPSLRHYATYAIADAATATPDAATACYAATILPLPCHAIEYCLY